MGHLRSVLIPTLTIAAAVTLAGCAPAVYPTASQTNIPATSPATSSDAPSAAGTPAPTSVPVPSASSTDPSSTRTKKHAKPASPPPCDSSKLAIYYSPVDNTAGQAHAQLAFLNKTQAACEAYGNPFVWFSDASGNKIGDEAKTIDGTAAKIITLQPNEAAFAPLTISDADFIGSCTVVSVTHMVVTPAGADNSALITIPATDACSNGIVTMTVGVVALK
jgi:hypothetical protein